MSRPKSPEDALASAHRANLVRYKVVPRRLIWLSGFASAGLVLAIAFLNLGLEEATAYPLFFAVHAALPILLGYSSATILGVWADLRQDDALYSLAVSLLSVSAIVLPRYPDLVNGIVPLGLMAAFLAVFGVRLGLLSNRIRWDRKVLSGSLPAPIEEGLR